MRFLELTKFCHYALYLTSFIGLLVPCYLFYMQEAIKDSMQQATTVTKRSEQHKFEAPVIIICPEPNFKPSISKQLNVSVPVRDIFLTESDFTNFLDMNLPFKENVQELYEQFSYTNDFTYLYNGIGALHVLLFWAVGS